MSLDHGNSTSAKAGLKPLVASGRELETCVGYVVGQFGSYGRANRQEGTFSLG